jgi:hypothetical protein
MGHLLVESWCARICSSRSVKFPSYHIEAVPVLIQHHLKLGVGGLEVAHFSPLANSEETCDTQKRNGQLCQDQGAESRFGSSLRALRHCRDRTVGSHISAAVERTLEKRHSRIDVAFECCALIIL